MKLMTSSPVETADLLDLKLLPAWVKEPGGARDYEHYTGEEESGVPKKGQGRPQHRKTKRRTSNIQRPTSKGGRGQREGLRKKTGGSDRRSNGDKNRRSLIGMFRLRKRRKL